MMSENVEVVFGCDHRFPESKCQYCMIQRWNQIAECLDALIHKIDAEVEKRKEKERKPSP